MTPGWTYALALLGTITIETGLACALRRSQARRLLVDVPLMNLVSHPLLWLGMGLGLPLGLGELLVMAFETIIYRRVTGLRSTWSVALGVGLNLLTWFIGMLAWS